MDFLIFSQKPAQDINVQTVDRLDRLQQKTDGLTLGSNRLFFGTGCHSARTDSILALARQKTVYDPHSGRSIPLSRLPDEMATPDALVRNASRWLAPFVVVRAAKADEPIMVVPDSLGLSHVFVWAASGVVAVSSSAALLAWVAGRPLHDEGLGQLSLFGHCAFGLTPFSGVTKLAPGSYVEIGDGAAVVRQLEPSVPRQSTFATGRDAAGAGADVISSMMAGMLDAYPDCGLELSGGLDSRLMLAGMPAPRRTGRHALTIGAGETPDVAVARRLAALTGLSHEIVDIGWDTDAGSGTVDRLLAECALAHDFLANPIDQAVLRTVEERFVDVVRLSGQNGEMARGFYYPLLPYDRPRKAGQIDHLYKWRLTTNDRVAANWLSQPTLQSIETRTKERLAEKWPADLPLLGDELDQFYLDFRMQNWCGSNMTVAQSSRTPLLPFFSFSFIAWLKSVSVTQKANSRLMYQVLQRLSPELATLPLDNGLVPARLAEGSSVSPFDRLMPLGRKIFRKVGQRLLGVRSKTLASDVFVDRINRTELKNWRDELIALPLELLNHGTLARIGSKELTGIDRPTAGFLLNVIGAHRAIIGTEPPLRPLLVGRSEPL